MTALSHPPPRILLKEDDPVEPRLKAVLEIVIGKQPS